MAAANAADPKTGRKTEAERPAVFVAAGSGRVGPSRAEWGRVGPGRAEWGWGGVGHALGFGPGYKDRPSGAAWGRFGPSGAE